MTKPLFCLLGVLTAATAAAQSAAPLPPVRILLVGDSTVAVNNGWGPGFCDRAVSQLTCENRAKNGRSTSSYRKEGSWAAVLEELRNKTGFAATYVLIQFGHNDQPGKPGRSTDLATEFPANLRRYVEDVRSAGAKPVLVTSLTRRFFRNGRVNDDLEPWAEATRRVARDTGVPVLDLHTESMAAVERMGPVEANTLAMAPPPPVVAAGAASGDSVPVPKNETPGQPAELFDYTHLGAKGSAFFGRMVVDELVTAVPNLRPYLRP